jgi:hypothetical protein
MGIDEARKSSYPCSSHEGIYKRSRRYTQSEPRNQMDESNQLHALTALPPGEELGVPIEQETEWAAEPV